MTCKCGHELFYHMMPAIDAKMPCPYCDCKRFESMEEPVSSALEKAPYTIKDSGKRQEFPTGAVRDIQEGKGRYDLLPPYSLSRLAKHYEAGSRKYSDDNWRKGIPTRRYADSALRHLLQYLDGERSEDHLSAVLFNVCGIIETQEMIRRKLLPPELDNIPDWSAKS